MSDELPDFLSMRDDVEAKLGFDIRDCGKHFYPETGNFTDWHKKKRLPKKDPDGKAPNCSQIWFSEYQDDIRAKRWLDTPYLDFWHFQLDNCFLDPDLIRNGTSVHLYVGKPFGDWMEWQIEIQNAWNELFGSLADENGYVEVWLSW